MPQIRNSVQSATDSPKRIKSRDASASKNWSLGRGWAPTCVVVSASATALALALASAQVALT